VAAAARIGAALVRRKRSELLDLLRPCFARTGPWLQACKYAVATKPGHAVIRLVGVRHLVEVLLVIVLGGL
jgi:hypothetical protein